MSIMRLGFAYMRFGFAYLQFGFAYLRSGFACMRFGFAYFFQPCLMVSIAATKARARAVTAA